MTPEKIAAFRAKAAQRIEEAAQRVADAMAQGLPPYIVRARRNALFCANSDAAMLEARIMMERE